MNLEKLTNKEIEALRHIGWTYTDFIKEIYYDSSKELYNDKNGMAKIAFFAVLDVCHECTKELSSEV